MPTSTRRNCAFSRKSDANPKHFNGPMRRPQASFEAQPRNARLLAPRWASAPTKDITRFHDFGGRTESSAPTNGIEKTCVGRKTAAFPILRRRGRCLHRPAENARFMAVFRRIRVDFPSYAVGADDPVRPPELPVFTEIRCEIAALGFVSFRLPPCRG